jgi:hypothetical protein
MMKEEVLVMNRFQPCNTENGRGGTKEWQYQCQFQALVEETV